MIEREKLPRRYWTPNDHIRRVMEKRYIIFYKGMQRLSLGEFSIFLHLMEKELVG